MMFHLYHETPSARMGVHKILIWVIGNPSNLEQKGTEKENRLVMPRGVLIWGRKSGTYGMMNEKSHLTTGFVSPLLLVVFTLAF